MSNLDKNPGFDIDSFIISNHFRLDENIRKVEARNYFRFEGALYYIDGVSHILENVTAHMIIDKNGDFVWGAEKARLSFKQVVPGLLSRKESEVAIMRTLISILKKREERIVSRILGSDFGSKSSPYDAREIRKPTWEGFDDFGDPLPRTIDNTSFINENSEIFQIPLNNKAEPTDFLLKPKPEKINTFDRISTQERYIDTSSPPYQKRPK